MAPPNGLENRSLSSAEVIARLYHEEQDNQRSQLAASDGALLIDGRAERTQATKKRQKKKRRTLQMTFNGIVAVTTFFLMLLTGYQAYIFHTQWQETKISNRSTTTQIWNAIGNLNWLAQSTQESLAVTRDQFRSDQRPYVWLTNEHEGPAWLPSTVKPGFGQVLWNVHYTNYGKSPARNLITEHFISIGTRRFRASFGKAEKTPGLPMPPNKNDFLTVVSAPEITQQEWNEITRFAHVGPTVSIRVVFRYSDAFGGQYETGVCESRTNAGSIAYCLDGNYIK